MHRLLVLLFIFKIFAAHADPTEKLNIFVSIPPQKFLVDRIGGERVRVLIMLKPAQSPETYDPTPRQIADLTGTQIYFRIGVPFEQHWMPKIASQQREMLVVDCCNQMMRDQDPHIWTDPLIVKIIAGQIKDVLSDRDPGSAQYYSNNYIILMADLDKLDQDIRSSLADRRTDYFIVSHAGWKYFADAYGLRQIALDEYGREKGPRGLAEMVELARREHIATVFVQAQHPTGAAYTLAKELNAKVVSIDNLAENYLENFYHISKLLAEAVR